MKALRGIASLGTGPILTGTSLLLLALLSWVILVAPPVAGMMGGAVGSLPGAASYVAMWGVMMTAMMLPSAMPMILLYRTVGSRLPEAAGRAIPAWLFAGIYLVVWLVVGIPVYGASVAVTAAADHWIAVDRAEPYLVAIVLASAGFYQLSPFKHECLRKCKSPLAFLMDRWRSGFFATARLALSHALYCVGCCAGLMVILVAAGAMSISWVIVIAVMVFAEKILPRGENTARIAGFALFLLALAAAINPHLIRSLRWPPAGAMPGMSH